MPFFNEVIPQDFRNSFDFSIFKNIYGRPFRFEPWGEPTWVIDKQRDAFLLYVGAGGGQHVGSARREAHAFWLKGLIGYFEGDLLVEKTENGNVLTWGNAGIGLPSMPEAQREEFIAVLKEAINAQGWHGDRQCLTAVVINVKSTYELK